MAAEKATKSKAGERSRGGWRRFSLALGLLVAGCASTTVQKHPAPPVCTIADAYNAAVADQQDSAQLLLGHCHAGSALACSQLNATLRTVAATAREVSLALDGARPTSVPEAVELATLRATFLHARGGVEADLSPNDQSYYTALGDAKLGFLARALRVQTGLAR